MTKEIAEIIWNTTLENIPFWTVSFYLLFLADKYNKLAKENKELKDKLNKLEESLSKR